MISYFQAAVIGAAAGRHRAVPDLQPRPLVLVPAWLGGSWEHLVTESSSSDSESRPYLAFIVALHVAHRRWRCWCSSARDWVRIIAAFFRTLRPTAGGASSTATRRTAGLAARHRHDPGRHHRPAAGAHLPHAVRQAARRGDIPHHQRGDPARRRAAAPPGSARRGRARREDGAPTAPAGAAGAARRHARPTRPARAWRRAPASAHAVLPRGCRHRALPDLRPAGRHQPLRRHDGRRAASAGSSHEDAARFSFLLATPVILAAGVLKLPDLAGSAGDDIHGQVIVGVRSSPASPRTCRCGS